MDQPKELQWEHVMIRPCYVNYMVHRHMPLERLTKEWLNANSNYDSMDVELRVQAWHDIMSIVKCFRERGEWDKKNHAPKEHAQEVKGKPMWVSNGLKPKTSEWIEHWKAYPKEQPSMARHSIRMAKEEAKNGKKST